MRPVESGETLRRWLASLALLSAAAGAAGAPSVALKLESSTAYANEAFTVTLEISDFRTADEPQWPEIPGCSVRLLGSPAEFSQFTLIGGRRSESHSRTYQYELIPTVVGELVIPSIAVQVDGRTLRTNPTRVRVLASDAERLLSAEIVLGRSRVYVGQRVTATLTVWVRPPVWGTQRVDPTSVLQSLSVTSLGPFPRQISNAANVGRMREVDGQRELYYAFDFVTQIVPEKPGRLEFDEIEFGLVYPTGSGKRHLRARPTVAPVEILPVPTEGRPAAFNGAVGLYDIKTSASPTSVRVGDPIQLTIEVFGDGPVESLPPPLLSANQRLVDDFRLPDETLAGEMRDGRRRFTLTIRARHEKVTEIPSIEYPYFDPDAERFVIARSAPIPLVVTPAAEIAAPEVPRGPAGSGTGSANTLEALDGLRDIETREALLLAETSPLASGVVTGFLTVPPAIFFATWAGRALLWRYAADPARRRRQRALSTARRRIAQGRRRPPREWAAEIAAALTGYLADRQNEPAARFGGRAGVDFLRARGVRPELVAEWSRIVERCEEISFAGAPQADLDQLAAQALRCLAALGRERL